MYDNSFIFYSLNLQYNSYTFNRKLKLEVKSQIQKVELYLRHRHTTINSKTEVAQAICCREFTIDSDLPTVETISQEAGEEQERLPPKMM